MQITLSDYISDGKTLSEEQQSTLLAILGHGCRAKTKQRLRAALAFVPHIANEGIYKRVQIEPSVRYLAGQSYPDEIRTVMNCLI